jgi:hypothetical protein
MTPWAVLFSADARGCVHPSLTDPLGGAPEKYFFRDNYGKVFLVKHHLHAPPDIGAHALQRLKMKAARAAWRLLTPEEKEAYSKHPLALQRNLPGHNTFVSLHMRNLL